MPSNNLSEIHARAVELQELIRGLALMADEQSFHGPRVSLTHVTARLAIELAEEIDRQDDALNESSDTAQ